MNFRTALEGDADRLPSPACGRGRDPSRQRREGEGARREVRFATAKALAGPGLGRVDTRRPHPGSLMLAPSPASGRGGTY
ncbi:hypothetical protein MTBUT4_710004 [Magnetospirillum sp. UT-4]|nr:hypothetical protein MTBUT4_710004 [Magnetospirillum sp. UT-4]